MKFDNSFVVPIEPAQAWPLLLDVPTIAPCLPGAEITEARRRRQFRGRATVKIGPVQLAFDGETCRKRRAIVLVERTLRQAVEPAEEASHATH